MVDWHAVIAHGADLLGAFGRCERVAPDRMLRLGVARLLAPTDYVLRDQEDRRLAYALALTLTRTELTESEAVVWLGEIVAEFEKGKPGPVPAFASNTMRTLRSLYLFGDRGMNVRGHEAVAAIRHSDAVKDRIVQVPRIAFPAFA